MQTSGQSVGANNVALPDTATTKVSGNPFRVKRLQRFLELVDALLREKSCCRILDVGGEGAYWRTMRDVWGARNLEIKIVNIASDDGHCGPGITHETGNACDLSRFADGSFDIVHSNSVIEHVGMWADMQAMAKEVRRLAPAYFVQTPNYWFPLEPHLRTPFIHWLPRPLRQRIVMARACGFYPRAHSVDEAQKILADASLLDISMFAALFPDARIERERIGPLTKSLMAIKGAV